MCPTVKENDAVGDGILTSEEASGEYGTIFMALTTRGGATQQDGLDVAGCRLPTSRVGSTTSGRSRARLLGLLENLGSLHVVQHGINVKDNGKYDLDPLGKSTFAASLGVPNVPEEATDPASCGIVRGVSAAELAHRGPKMGGAPVAARNGPLLAAGVGLLLLSAAVAVSAAGARRRSSGR